MKKLISLTLILALALSLAACGASGSNGTAASASKEAPAVTEAPEEAETPAVTAAPASAGDAAEEPADSEEKPGIPSRFDLRDNDAVTSVKIQDPWQTCWAFAGTAAAESSILSMLKEKGQAVAAKDFDLSEKHLAWFATQPITENIDPAQAGEGLYLFNKDPNAVYDTGGMSLFVTTLFSTGVGPVYEKYFPYQGATGLSDKEYLTQHSDEAKKAVLDYVVLKLLSGVTLDEIVADPDSDDARAYINYLCDKGYMNKEDTLTLDLLEDVSYRMYLNEYSKITGGSRFDDWTIPELGEDGNPNRNITSGFTLVDGNILPALYNKDADGKWESVNWDGIQAVKEELMQGHAVSAGFKADVSAPGESIPENAYMDYDNWAHYTYEDVPQSHAVCIVGWDDDYPAGNFPKGHQPPADGAWLVKNSWGSETDYLDLREDAQIGKADWGIKDASGKHTGYFWISYYDKTLNNCETMSFDTDLSDAGGRLGVWMYDYMPSVVSADENTSVQSEDLIRTANVFKNDTGIDVELRAVSTKTANPDADVKYFIYQLNKNAENPEDGTLLAAGEGSFAYAGFHRVSLDDPITIKDDDTISIVAEESVVEDGKTLYEYGVNAAKTAANAEETGEPMYGVAVVNKGESFLFENGAWADWSEDERRESVKDKYAIDNFSIKAYVTAASEETHAVTEAPKATETPAATEAPKATEAPAATEASKATETPAAEGAPAVTETANSGEEVPEEAQTPDTAGAAEADSTKGTHEITSSNIPFYSGGALLGELPLYFLDGVKDLPYVEANNIPDVLGSAMGSLTGEYSFSAETDGSVVTITRNNKNPGAMDNGVYAAFDFENDTITFLDHDLFCWKPGATTVLDVSTVSTVNAEGEPTILQKVNKDSLDRYGNELVVRAGDYGIDFVEQDGKYLVPLQTLADFTLSPGRGYNLFYNGQVIILADQMNAENEMYYAVPTGDRSEALAEYGYNELCMMLDYCYGLKDVHAIESFDKLFQSVNFDKVLKEQDPANADIAVARMIWDYLDDGHSAWLASSYLAGSVNYGLKPGTSTAQIFAEGDRYSEARKKYYPDGVPGYEEIGNTAYITFDSFSISNPNDMESYYLAKDVSELADTDTIGLIMKAQEQITRENSPVENVVLDLSNNEGGAADAAIFTLGWLLGETSVGVENTMTGAMSSAIYRSDVNRDRKFDDKDTVADKNIYCLISPYSFSCANLVPNVLKASNKAVLLGRVSGGGSCMVQFASSAWGSSFRISSPKRLSFLKNGSFYDIDRGAEPDYLLSRPEEFYDRAALTEYINSLH